MKKIMLIVTFLMGFMFAQVASSASMLYIKNETFQSGAVFNGVVTFADNTYSQAVSVSGVLQGDVWGTQNLSWVWADGSNFAGNDSNYGTFLMNGTGYGNYSVWNVFTMQLSDLTFADSVGYGNSINYWDMRTGGIISTSAPTSVSSSATPIPAAIWLFGSGIAGLVSFSPRKRKIALAV
jgi:hypothetical protein